MAQIAHYCEAFSLETECCFRLVHAEDGTGRATPNTAPTSPNGVGGSRTGPASGGRSKRAMATGPTWTRSRGLVNRYRSARICPGAPESEGVGGQVRVNSLQDVARRETGRGSRPARQPAGARFIVPLQQLHIGLARKPCAGTGLAGTSGSADPGYRQRLLCKLPASPGSHATQSRIQHTREVVERLLGGSIPSATPPRGWNLCRRTPRPRSAEVASPCDDYSGAGSLSP